MAGRQSPDPFAVLGVPRSVDPDALRAARNRLAMDEHPDRGGSETRMQAINVAFEEAMTLVLADRAAGDRPASTAPSESAPSGPAPDPRPFRPGGRVQRDDPSFVIEALPAEAFEALLIVANWMGEVMVDDPPYLLEAHINDPAECWCRLELLAEAGASTVMLTVVAGEGAPPPIELVRDRWIENLNQLGQSPD